MHKFAPKPLRQILPLVAIGIAVLLVSLIIQSAIGTPTSNPKSNAITANSLKQPQVSYGQPVRVIIPSINVNAAVENVGLTSDLSLDVPKGPVNAGWYMNGPRPGQIGNSIIDGHFGWWKDGTATVFNSLYKLQKNEKIYVEAVDGTTTTFKVSGFGVYDPTLDSASVFNSVDKKAHLTLITCEGTWIPSQKTYSNRLIVFSDKQT